MPTYVYETIPANDREQPVRFELDQRMSEPALTKHPESGKPVRRIISGGLGFIGVEERGSSSAAGKAPMTCPHSGQTCGCD